MPEQALRIIAIRHGETDWNAGARLQGHLDIALNELGRRQAARLGPALRDEGIERVVASDLSRAWHTAQALAGALQVPVEPDTGLRERGFGELEGLTYQQIDERWPEMAQRWRSRDVDFQPPGGESLRSFYDRCVGAATRIASAHARHQPAGALALVAHGGVLDCLYRAASGVALQAPRSWVLGNASINRLLYTPQGFTLVGWNDSAHLDGLALDEIT